MTRKNNTEISLTEIRKDIQYLNETMKKGFEGVYKRQDTTNGKVLRNAENITLLQKDMGHKVSDETFSEHLFHDKEQTIIDLQLWKLRLMKIVGAITLALFVFWLGTLQ